MTKEDFQPGQAVYLITEGYLQYEYKRIEKRIIATRVITIGRKYITVEYLKLRFDITDFREVTDCTQNLLLLFPSVEEIKKRCARKQMEERIHSAFRCPSPNVAKKMTDDEVQTVYEIVRKYLKY